MKLFSISSALFFLAVANVIRGATWFPKTSPKSHLTIKSLELEMRGGSKGHLHVPDQKITKFLAKKAAENNSASIFVNKLFFSENSWYGPVYYSSKPDLIERDNIKLLYVESLQFLEYPINRLETTEEIECFKRVLVERKIFIGRDEPVMVGDVIVNNYSLGPIFLNGLSFCKD